MHTTQVYTLNWLELVLGTKVLSDDDDGDDDACFGH